MKIIFKIFISITCIISMVGCIRTQSTNDAVKKIMERENAMKTQIQSNVANSDSLRGSLWTNYGGLYSDPKAGRVNDIITVNVIEDTSGEKDAKTSLSKDSTLKASVNSFFGLEKKAANTSIDPSNLIDTSTQSKYEGEGATSRTGKLSAKVSAIVTDILPNGNLVISGSQTVTINNEEQVITLEGIVRPVDISTDNTVDSPRIANAKIIYTGKGVVADKQHPGWFIGVFDKVWPF